ncbi:YqcC family protein [Paraferrimonas haliotis]|uniref:YqcC-like domain-containing protein n=1 Tax=Paraferrimonas haliotis TaxID=2013866 RepID=A0AA37TN09_9GAMM|nr:YqcC family protein [Paraferrimonas haliotis]GLS82733.1 hypothetical protein GCM10007894_07100 [Paraferrimonas haliotis]
MTKTAQLQQLLAQLQAEMQQCGMWQSQPPSPQALASEQPFCVDTLRFEQWLQFIFLPKMTLLLNSGRPLPSSSGIAAMAQVAWRQRLDVGKLLAIINQFDEQITLK